MLQADVEDRPDEEEFGMHLPLRLAGPDVVVLIVSLSIPGLLGGGTRCSPTGKVEHDKAFSTGASREVNQSPRGAKQEV